MLLRSQLYTKTFIKPFLCEFWLKFLTCRFQASFTKDYLASVRQGDINLPDGPLLLNPTSLMNALHREVIEKKPEKFKIACLNDIKTLFPEENNPFFAGYGNRANVRFFYLEYIDSIPSFYY